MLELRNIEKTYRRGAEDVRALRGVNLEIGAGELVSVIGPSGAGKTTLLHLLGCLDLPTSGEIRFNGRQVEKMGEAELVVLRREKIGFIFQQFYLIPGLTVFDNISLPLLFSKRKVDNARIEELAGMVGLRARLHHVPAQLSGGEMQRVAIARALVNDPEIVLADEPTGNLDTENSENIFRILRELNGRGLTIVMITHNTELAMRTNRIIRLRDGRMVPDEGSAQVELAACEQGAVN